MNKQDIENRLKMLSEDASMLRERIASKDRLEASCKREVAEAEKRLADAQTRQRNMNECFLSDPGKLAGIEAEMTGLRQQLKKLANAGKLDKAKDLLAQIEKLRKLGYVITLPKVKIP